MTGVWHLIISTLRHDMILIMFEDKVLHFNLENAVEFTESILIPISNSSNIKAKIILISNFKHSQIPIQHCVTHNHHRVMTDFRVQAQAQKFLWNHVVPSVIPFTWMTKNSITVYKYTRMKNYRLMLHSVAVSEIGYTPVGVTIDETITLFSTYRVN